MQTIRETIRVQGVDVPRLGLGTWQLEGSDCVEAVRHALEIGYRHVDTAIGYGNEPEVGRGIEEAPVDREDVFLVTKVPPDLLAPAALEQAVFDSLRRLDTDHVNCLLIHWPSEQLPLDETLRAMVKLRDEDVVHHLGVSNFTPALLRRALDHAPLLTVQVEYHPFLSQRPILDLCEAHDLVLTAYSPLARGKVHDDETLRRIAARHGVTPELVALRWLLQEGPVAVIPKAGTAHHREENIRVFDLELDDDEMLEIEMLRKDQRIFAPTDGPRWEPRPEPPTA